jgi:hypothetical protein
MNPRKHIRSAASRNLAKHRALRGFRGRLEQLEPRHMMAGDAILHWNNVALDVVKDDHTFADLKEQTGPTKASRALAMVSVAMFDAINSIKGKYEPYLIMVSGAKNANIDAAVGQAAHDTLVSLYHDQKATIDAALNNWLGTIPNGKAEQAGIALGKTVAKAIIKARTNDGATDTSDYVYTDHVPGHHQSDPVQSAIQVPLTPQWGGVTPFGITSADAFLPPPPPAMDSPEYTAAFDELLRLGGDGTTTPTERTADQTEIGIFWAYDGTQGLCAPPRLYNQIAEVIGHEMGNSEYQNARYFALINVAMADAGIVGWDSKYTYDLWRPVMGIRNADVDGNPDTTAIPNWSPLGAPASNETFPVDFTPNFPSYVSGHAIFGAALFQTIRQFYGTNKIAFDFTSDEFNGTTTNSNGVVRPEVTRHYDTLSQASLENALSRIYLGIHWHFDATNGINAGNKIAQANFHRILQPLKHGMSSTNNGSLPVLAYVQDSINCTFMDAKDGVHRQVVMMTPVATSHGTAYKFSTPNFVSSIVAFDSKNSSSAARVLQTLDDLFADLKI